MKMLHLEGLFRCQCTNNKHRLLTSNKKGIVLPIFFVFFFLAEMYLILSTNLISCCLLLWTIAALN